jgi:NAD-dependent dihydropyrimidine dehydrogenase PreA subunit
VEVTVIPHLYDLKPDGTGVLCLSGITSDVVLLSWLYERAARWVLDRFQIHGTAGVTLLKSDEEEEEEADDEADSPGADASDGKTRVIDSRPTPGRKIYCLDLKSHGDPAPYVEEIRRIVRESQVKTVDLMGWIQGTPSPDSLARYLSQEKGPAPAAIDGSGAGSDRPAGVVRIAEEPGRRWYPVIDYSRCTNCMECLDFCLFGVYGLDRQETILVEQPDNCRKGCPACSRVCPENAILFPQHKTPAIAGSPDGSAGAFKIDLSKLFGAPDALDTAVAERDVELVAAGRDAVGATMGMPKRQAGKKDGPKDDLDKLMDELDQLV